MIKAKLIIRRNAPEDIKMRDLYVQVDGAREHTLQYGQTLELEVDPGQHQIKATNRLFTKTSDFSLHDDQPAVFTVANVGAGCMGVLMLLGGTGGYRVTLDRVNE